MTAGGGCADSRFAGGSFGTGSVVLSTLMGPSVPVSIFGGVAPTP